MKKAMVEKKTDLSVYLTASRTSSLPPHWEVYAIFTFFLYNQISDTYVCFRGKARRFHAVNPKWGFAKLISKESLTDPSNGYLVDDKCVFGAEVFVIKSQRIVESLCLKRVTQPYKHEWKISQFSKLEYVWESGVFEAGDHKWVIFLYPRGTGNEVGRYASILVQCIDAKGFAPHDKLKANVSITVKNHFSLNCTRWFTSAEAALRYGDFLPISDTGGVRRKFFTAGDVLLLEIDVSIHAYVRDTLN